MTAALAAAQQALIAGRCCAICDKPTGYGRRMYCSSPYCRDAVAKMYRRHRAERLARAAE